MERGFSMKVRLLRAAVALLWLLSLSAFVPGAQQRELVLVTADSSEVPALTASEVRRLFLGVVVEKGDRRLVPIQNLSEPLLHEVFLQKVVFMSSRSYERHLLAQMFRSGGHRPARYAETGALVAALQRQPGAVTYMWSSSAKQTPGIKVVQELWRGETD
jgi:hypothetical protein